MRLGLPEQWLHCRTFDKKGVTMVWIEEALASLGAASVLWQATTGLRRFLAQSATATARTKTSFPRRQKVRQHAA